MSLTPERPEVCQWTLINDTYTSQCGVSFNAELVNDLTEDADVHIDYCPFCGGEIQVFTPEDCLDISPAGYV